MHEKELCDACEDSFVYINDPVCRNCGHELKHCLCRGRQYSFERCIEPFYYCKSVKKGIWRFKFCGEKAAAKHFGKYMTACIKKHYDKIHFDFIVAVPLYKKRKSEREYNQSELLAKHISREMNIQMNFAGLVKINDTPPQHTLKNSERQSNVKGAFCCNSHALNGKTILLVDDIVTTGSTLNECAKVLKGAGAKKVYCVTIAAVNKNISDG